MLGEYEQELVVDADGFVDGGSDPGTYPQVVGGKPDAHTFGLEVGVEAVRAA